MDKYKKNKILLVDDEANILIAIEFLLSREGFDIRKASNGRDALETAVAFKPDVIVLDVMMPELDGFEVSQKIRAMPALANTQVVFLTAKGTQGDRRKGYDVGGEHYIVKPFDNDDLVQTIKELIEYG